MLQVLLIMVRTSRVSFVMFVELTADFRRPSREMGNSWSSFDPPTTTAMIRVAPRTYGEACVSQATPRAARARGSLQKVHTPTAGCSGFPPPGKVLSYAPPPTRERVIGCQEGCTTFNTTTTSGSNDRTSSTCPR